MDRRTFVLTAGGTLTVGLAGCTSTQTALEVANSDTEDVDEAETLYMTGTVENTSDESSTGMIHGEIESDNEIQDEKRREITVPGGEEAPFNLKFRYDIGLVDFYDATAEIESDPSDDPRFGDGFHDLVVVETEGPSEDDIEDGSPTITATVENRAEESRTATLEATVTISEEPHNERQEVSLDGGESDSFDFDVSAPSPSGVYTYDGSAKFIE